MPFSLKSSKLSIFLDSLFLPCQTFTIVIGGPDLNKNPRVRYKNRVKILKFKAYELSEKCGANMYFIIDHEREFFVYNFVDDADWPPADSLLVGPLYR